MSMCETPLIPTHLINQYERIQESYSLLKLDSDEQKISIFVYVPLSKWILFRKHVFKETFPQEMLSTSVIKVVLHFTKHPLDVTLMVTSNSGQFVEGIYF